MTKKKTKNILNIALKLLFVMLFIIVIYRQVFVKNDSGLMWQELKMNLHSSNVSLMIIAVLLMFVNWSFEALKWQILTSSFETISFVKSLKTVLLGLATGIVTPAKLGDYFGRVLLLDNKNNWKGVWATFISGIAQNLVTVIVGFTGLIFFTIDYYKVDDFLFYSFVYIGLFLIIILIFLYYNIDFALYLAKKIGLKKIVKKIIDSDTNSTGFITKSILNKVLFLSFLRYTVFAVQFLLIIRFFGIEGNTFAVLAAISIIFFIQSSIPLPPVMNILARGEVSILLLSNFTDNKILILSSAFSIWFINILIPSIVGLILIIRVNIPKSFGYD